MDHDLPDSFQSLFRQYYPMVVRKIKSIVQDSPAAEDLAQEVFLRLYRNPPNDLTRVGPWLQRTLTRVAYDSLRQSVRRRNLTDKLEQSAELEIVPDSETMVLDKLDRTLIADALAMLSERDRQSLLLKHSGYSYAEMARILNVNPDTVGTLVLRASARFKKAYEKQEGWSDGKRNDHGSGCGRGLGAV